MNCKNQQKKSLHIIRKLLFRFILFYCVYESSFFFDNFCVLWKLFIIEYKKLYCFLFSFCTNIKKISFSWKMKQKKLFHTYFFIFLTLKFVFLWYSSKKTLWHERKYIKCCLWMFDGHERMDFKISFPDIFLNIFLIRNFSYLFQEKCF